MRKVVCVAAARTPFGNYGGKLRDFTTVELGTIAVKEVVKRAGLGPDDVDECYIGINMPSSNRSIARQVTLSAGLSESLVSATMDRACCSSAVATAMGYRAILVGEADVVITGGSENMSATPYFLEKLRWGTRIGSVTLEDIIQVTCPYTGERRAVQAGSDAVKFGITREEQDQWAVRSQQRYAAADAEGKFDQEIVPVEIKVKKNIEMMTKDEAPRPTTNVEALAKLPTVYNSPTVTAGNAPGLNTGASALVLMSEEKAKELGLKPIFEIVGHLMASGHPSGISSIPGYAAADLLKKCDMTVDQIDLIEVNEAFAVMPLLSTAILGDFNAEKVAEIREKTNVNGGAIAIGHPTGASATRLLMTMGYELQRRGGGYGLMAICGGVGEGECFIIKA